MSSVSITLNFDSAEEAASFFVGHGGKAAAPAKPATAAAATTKATAAAPAAAATTTAALPGMAPAEPTATATDAPPTIAEVNAEMTAFMNRGGKVADIKQILAECGGAPSVKESTPEQRVLLLPAFRDGKR